MSAQVKAAAAEMGESAWRGSVAMAICLAFLSTLGWKSSTAAQLPRVIAEEFSKMLVYGGIAAALLQILQKRQRDPVGSSHGAQMLGEEAPIDHPMLRAECRHIRSVKQLQVLLCLRVHRALLAVARENVALQFTRIHAVRNRDESLLDLRKVLKRRALFGLGGVPLELYAGIPCRDGGSDSASESRDRFPHLPIGWRRGRCLHLRVVPVGGRNGRKIGREHIIRQETLSRRAAPGSQRRLQGIGRAGVGGIASRGLCPLSVPIAACR